jgi:hypothetical protein
VDDSVEDSGSVRRGPLPHPASSPQRAENKQRRAGLPGRPGRAGLPDRGCYDTGRRTAFGTGLSTTVETVCDSHRNVDYLGRAVIDVVGGNEAPFRGS